jgi:large subunit ribosomal protein L45
MSAISNVAKYSLKFLQVIILINKFNITTQIITLLQVHQTNFLLPATASGVVNLQQYRHRRTKHWDPKWKKLRAVKVVKIELPSMNEKMEDLTQEEIRTKMKQRGLLPPRPYMERQFYVSSTGGTFEPYVPPEGDGKKSAISGVGAKQKVIQIEKKTKSMLAIRKIRTYEEDFEAAEFAARAQEIYNQAHQVLSEKNKYKLRELVTERAYPEMMHNIKDKTIHWKFLKSLEAPKVVHARCTDVITKENIFGQVTVRLHTQQMLAIYDRFGRLMHGSEILAKDVLEYVVFEKHLSNEYGVWRLHDKLIPEWTEEKQPAIITYRVDDEPEPVAEVQTTSTTEEGVEKKAVEATT